MKDNLTLPLKDKRQDNNKTPERNTQKLHSRSMSSSVVVLVSVAKSVYELTMKIFETLKNIQQS